jgi:hypothetical protein
VKKLRIIGIIALMSLCPAFCRAESQLWALHDFSDMREAGRIRFTNSYKVGTTDTLVYTCSGTSAEFTHTVDDVISLPKNGSQVVISPAISKLSRVEISHYQYSTCTNIKVYVSTDGTTWGSPISGSDIDYNAGGRIDVTLPRRAYYIKIANTTTAAFTIYRITYYTEDCNCFLYTPE